MTRQPDGWPDLDQWSDQDLAACLNNEADPLNAARRAFNDWCARIDQAGQQRIPVSPVARQRMAFAAVIAIARALGAPPPADLARDEPTLDVRPPTVSAGRKVVHITTGLGQRFGDGSDGNPAIYALCDDGSIWEWTQNTHWFSPRWTQLPEDVPK